MTRRCRGCGHRLRLPSPDGLGPVCRARLAGTPDPTPHAPVAPAAGQLELEEPMTDRPLTVHELDAMHEAIDNAALAREQQQTHADTTARPAGYHRAALINRLDGGMCDDMDSKCERCDEARALVDAYRTEVLDQALTEVGGMVGQNPAIDNETVMACVAVLGKLIDTPAAAPQDDDGDAPCGEGMCQCRCSGGAKHSCGCDCAHHEDCDCEDCIDGDGEY